VTDKPVIVSVPGWTRVLQMIPTLVWVLVVSLLLLYKPNGYKTIAFAFVAAFILVAAIMFLSARKARARNLNNG
jgi:hypothetical protein